MGLVGTIAAQIGLINLFYHRIFMGFADRFVSVIFVQSSRPPRFQIDKVAHCRRLYRLTAAVDTAARAAHDLDEVVVLFPGFDRFEDFLGVL